MFQPESGTADITPIMRIRSFLQKIIIAGVRQVIPLTLASSWDNTMYGIMVSCIGYIFSA